ncbi:unnamed protein product [Lactuca saligna]|uniref:DUF7792 domain-containing protein n=1 Tax=Lactuca saligna TaxID=75948 RepID=A0AA36DXW5_LACSI|nr:unnamed protein product [Lactuca saligna]CAI9275114.1 unnamed protein product [Lactuca saligna]
MAELNFENHPLEKVVSSMITLCDSVIVIGSKASVHESYCQIVARKVEDIRELLESVMHFMFYDRPIRFILPFVNQTLRTVEKELNEFCLLLPILARTTLVLKLPKLERDLIDVSGDLFWIEELLRKGYRLQRVEQNGEDEWKSW